MRPLRFFLLLSAILLAACGNKGPLVQPDKAQPAQDSSKK
jgi:predicted small lipoprotein YifL